MIEVRKSEERGHANHGWLDSYHTFSFANYYDPRFVGFRDLLVINEDRIQASEGFGTHGHQNMEIITYIIEGALEHRDSMGTGSVIRSGDVQRMSAGTGVQHSEFNHSKEEIVHLLQIWIKPDKNGIKPSYEEKKFTSQGKRNQLGLIVSPNGEEGSLGINQNVNIFSTLLDEGKSIEYKLNAHRYAWIQVARGSITLNGTVLDQGDGASVSHEALLNLVAKKSSEVLLFDLP